ncbi:MAG: DNA topoisomerase IV subunit A [Deltaproteobacteria bacterium]|nr:DNA topoisomerase IV subunit A [Deltaproteobacteria bacterium]
MDHATSVVDLSTEAERLYLNYALSVITARALPDVRDGLKPVQRRILTMLNELGLRPDAKAMKCARIVGDVMGKLHPHGDSAIYEALVRMAQSWVLRAPLVFGQGNFGSLDGDAPAAMRYTEARLEAIAGELLAELPRKTVEFRQNYDGTRFEPVVLPARFPNLLVNGSSGIAVGMATDIPPHNLGEVIDACLELIENPKVTIRGLLAKVKGPDFPTGGEILNSRDELVAIYESGRGSIGVRGEWTTEEDKKGFRIVITSVPYGLEKRVIIEKVAEVILGKKLPHLVDVRDESTDKVRIVLELKKDSSPELVMAYVYKHTPLQGTVQVNLTCLVPTSNPQIGRPERLDLKQMLQHFLDFRFEVVTRRIQFDLDSLNKRLHLLEGFEKVFDALDEIIKIIRKSEGKKDAAEKIMKRFGLDDEQTEAILELKLYRLARLEILVIQQEAEEKRKEAKSLGALLKSADRRWGLVKSELEELKKTYADKRRSKILRSGAEEIAVKEEDFIVEQDAVVIATAQGWVKRQQSVKDLSTTRIREGDQILACQAGSTRAPIVFFSSQGVAYVSRVADIPASTGYGDPLQKLFKLGDGERLVGMLALDPRVLEVPEPNPKAKEPEPPYAVAVTRQGLAFRFSLRQHRDPSTRAGRKYARLNEGDEVLTVISAAGNSFVLAVADDGHAIAVDIAELPVLSGAGKGVMLIKLDPTARLLGAIGAPSPRVGSLLAFTEKGSKYELFADALRTTRGGRGSPVVKRSRFDRVELPPPAVPDLGGAKE